MGEANHLLLLWARRDKVGGASEVSVGSGEEASLGMGLRVSQLERKNCGADLKNIVPNP